MNPSRYLFKTAFEKRHAHRFMVFLFVLVDEGGQADRCGVGRRRSGKETSGSVTRVYDHTNDTHTCGDDTAGLL
ncbi:hypothetical protein GGS23DRAFT_551350 [Durotheca rogersii]|uniref:uncharacterized protein n=1 Tax=Durotheca rogersii TaxID=419775 RepID=UPI00221F9022|nr:uncharacterized protein GGS23DRAFT_551350 [Durotheca rogersii]KAI5866628.1 hypothetical protein GGS23DRAFT_551350 [Durotheca rogersii]